MFVIIDREFFLVKTICNNWKENKNFFLASLNYLILNEQTSEKKKDLESLIFLEILGARIGASMNFWKCDRIWIFFFASMPSSENPDGSNEACNSTSKQYVINFFINASPFFGARNSRFILSSPRLERT